MAMTLARKQLPSQHPGSHVQDISMNLSQIYTGYREMTGDFKHTVAKDTSLLRQDSPIPGLNGT